MLQGPFVSKLSFGMLKSASLKFRRFCALADVFRATKSASFADGKTRVEVAVILGRESKPVNL